jgi:hypothetical protein
MKRENPDAAPPVAPSATAEPRPESPAPAPLAAESVLLELEPAVAAAPSESMAGVVTVEPNEAIGAPSEAPASSSEAPPVARQSPRAVRVLPRRPRLRASFHYDPSDALSVELTLMDERRELIHRMQLVSAPGGAIARIFEALLGVVTQAAASAGVFGNRER